MSTSLLVTGASGQMGQRVLELLLESNTDNLIAVTRSPEKLANFAEQGVDVRYGSFDEPDSLVQAFDGADRLLLISTDELGEPGKRLNQHQAAVKAADEAGVSHILYTSIIEATDTPVLFATDHSGTEQAIRDSKMGYTILRNNIYMDLLVYTLSQAYQMGGLISATGEGKIAYITREDCARVAAAALAAPFEGKRILDITGAESLTQGEIAAIASDLTGEKLTYTAIPVENLIEGMVGAGLPKPVAETYASIDLAMAQGKMANVSTAVEDLTGAKPMTISDFLTVHKAALLEAAKA